MIVIAEVIKSQTPQESRKLIKNRAATKVIEVPAAKLVWFLPHDGLLSRTSTRSWHASKRRRTMSTRTRYHQALLLEGLCAARLFLPLCRSVLYHHTLLLLLECYDTRVRHCDFGTALLTLVATMIERSKNEKLSPVQPDDTSPVQSQSQFPVPCILFCAINQFQNLWRLPYRSAQSRYLL